MPGLRARLAMSPHYLIRLRKRAEAEAAYADRVSVGRAVSADVVLRHQSVSKSHAYFRLEGHIWQLSDAASKNGSQLNGDTLVAREPQTLRAGDRIRFGVIDVIFLDATTLWRALRPSG
jgi:pSer/pThr/pTyr-binding forkhead associated (FHA) protein